MPRADTMRARDRAAAVVADDAADAAADGADGLVLRGLGQRGRRATRSEHADATRRYRRREHPVEAFHCLPPYRPPETNLPRSS